MDITAHFVGVVNFVSVDFGSSESFQLSVVVVNMVQLVEFLNQGGLRVQRQQVPSCCELH